MWHAKAWKKTGTVEFKRDGKGNCYQKSLSIFNEQRSEIPML
jgi:hypothetical protein